MRHNNHRRRNNNRGFNRNNNRGGGRNNAHDSVNPAGGRLRGTAQQLMEKYQELARAAAASGDQTLAENQLQHAEHYARVLNAHLEAMGMAPYQADDILDDNDEEQSDDEAKEANPPRQSHGRNRQATVADDDQPSLGDFEPPEFLRGKN